ncbi:MAG: dTDP-glucose 4,6-dehydratase [Alphaproteobacteria bacterium MarineAlpha5_Bin8]|nr:MAG: dTDP-glucose 4,6-dehydratase [Alphaproteobacteria bacterium MarineAlpha5_Bin8]PPR54535.1 MAG: dTDP-glucose 4,6-dehydratase [Alphaproteobacteria bacterium MarineAlpha5_Bin6]|tara:strand:+ start:768 stop:1742 length:975 start_codon:yes stop_codon:yes gene_type:complete
MGKIFITGATGFIGSHLAELCVKKGHKVVAFDRYNPNNDFGWLENSKYKKEIEIILGDIRDYDSVFNAMKGCATIFHLAALIGIPYSYLSPIAYIRTNLEGTYNVLEASKNKKIDQILITSTSETYGNAQYTPIDEKHSLNAQSPYAASKIAADHLSLSYYRSFDLPIKIIRPFNTFGPRQSSRAIIPTIVNQTLSKKNKIKVGNISPTRDFTYVEDTCSAFLEVLKNEKLFGEIVNVGSNNEISIKNIINLVFDKLDINKKIEIVKLRKRPNKSEVDRLVCDNTKIIKNTNWKPKINFDEGLLKTIDWLKNNYNISKHDKYHV